MQAVACRLLGIYCIPPHILRAYVSFPRRPPIHGYRDTNLPPLPFGWRLQDFIQIAMPVDLDPAILARIPYLYVQCRRLCLGQHFEPKRRNESMTVRMERTNSCLFTTGFK
jgi:hypothetical protein